MAGYVEFSHSADVAKSEAMRHVSSFSSDNPHLRTALPVYHESDGGPRPAGMPEKVHVTSMSTSRSDRDVAQLDRRAAQSHSGRVQTFITDSGTPRIYDTTYKARHDSHVAGIVRQPDTHAYSVGSHGPRDHQLKHFAKEAGHHGHSHKKRH
eukprot:scpid94443/ scgid11249/ 